MAATATARGRGDGRLEVLEVVPAGQGFKDLRESPRVHILTTEHIDVVVVYSCYGWCRSIVFVVARWLSVGRWLSIGKWRNF